MISENPTHAQVPVEPDRYPVQWTLLFLLLAGCGIFHWFSARAQRQANGSAPIVASNPKINWFLVLRMPAFTAQYESGIETMKGRYEEWLSGLLDQGFHPMLLSDIHERLERGEGLPEKAIVLVFDPGFRRTYRNAAPILARHQIPAVWLSNGNAMQHGHREYITYHNAQQMVDSGFWDVGISDDHGGYTLKTHLHGAIALGDSQNPAWSAVTGGIALNRGSGVVELNRLNVISDWTKEDFLNRLQAEVPIERDVALTEGPVQNLNWGLSEESGATPAPMNLQVLPYKRGLVLDWFGTKGIAQCELHAKAAVLVGEFTMRFRWDEAHGDGITVLVTKDQLAVFEMVASHLQKKWLYRRALSGNTAGFDALVHLENSQLTITLDGKMFPVIGLQMQPTPGRGLFQLFLVDKFRGTARADAVQLTFKPL